MVTYLEAIVLGLVQGLTEWLPISSSGHLVIVQHLLNIEEPVMLDLFLHLGTLLVVFMVFHRDIAEIIRAAFTLDFASYHGRMATYILAGSAITGAIGFLFHDFIVSLFRIRFVGFALLANAAILLLSKRPEKNRRLSFADSLLIGAAQGLSLVPGISRSGATISMGLIRGIKKETAARFSFILSVPAITGAAIFEFTLEPVLYGPVLAGTAIATIVGYLSLRILLRIISRRKFHVFGYYCLAVSLIILLS
ncbi:MAG: undecaprenyl-diphosphate phosphatase [archaeon]